MIEGRIANESEGLIKLVSFEKMKGQSFEAMGVKGYRMEYKAKIEFVDDCVWGDFHAAATKRNLNRLCQCFVPYGTFYW